jgi:hypothetical protein
LQLIRCLCLNNTCLHAEAHFHTPFDKTPKVSLPLY